MNQIITPIAEFFNVWPGFIGAILMVLTLVLCYTIGTSNWLERTRLAGLGQALLVAVAVLVVGSGYSHLHSASHKNKGQVWARDAYHTATMARDAGVAEDVYRRLYPTSGQFGSYTAEAIRKAYAGEPLND